MRKVLIILLMHICIIEAGEACTSVIISGKCTIDGRPLLWKNRDTDFPDNRLMYFGDGKYTYFGLVNSTDKEGKEIWIGMNSTGFAIMNTASYNLNDNDTTTFEDQEGCIIRMALKQCATVKDFENLLKSLKKPAGLEANFGVIDAEGNAVYFEVSNYNYKIFDVNDRNVAPLGYLIRTNYSFSGTQGEGYGYERYQMAQDIFYEASNTNNLSAKFIFQEAARCLKHGLTKVDLKEMALNNNDNSKMFWMTDFIPRHSTSASVVIQGIKKNEDPALTTMWTVLGFPLCSVVFPVWFNENKELPKLLIADETGFAPLCTKALKLKDKCFPMKRSNGENYIALNSLYSPTGNGIIQKLKPLEDEIFQESFNQMEKWRKSKISSKEIATFYDKIDLKITNEYLLLFGL